MPLSKIRFDGKVREVGLNPEARRPTRAGNSGFAILHRANGIHDLRSLVGWGAGEDGYAGRILRVIQALGIFLFCRVFSLSEIVGRRKRGNGPFVLPVS